MGTVKMKVITKTHIKDLEKLEEKPAKSENENENENERFVEFERVDSVQEVELES